MSSDLHSLIFAKSIALIQKTKKRVSQIDSTEFPTSSSEQAKQLLLDTLDALTDKSFWPAMNPEVLYNALIRIQGLVSQIEASNNKHISWPLVSFCDQYWKLLFPNDEAQIFYSVMTEHNYGIGSFSLQLKSLIEKVLPPSQIDKILKKQNLYCLQLASFEDENLPLYANIGHEFGHAVYWFNSTPILRLLANECENIFKNIATYLRKLDSALAYKRITKTWLIITNIATELFCDLFGILISGPAFLLSLYEMTWGIDQGTWSAHLTPNAENISAYPSFWFRIQCLMKLNRITSFQNEAIDVFDGLSKEKLPEMASYLSTITKDHSSDHVEVLAFYDPDNDRYVIESVITKYIEQLEQSLERFVSKCWDELITTEMKDKQFAPTSANEVFKLLQRLENDILPNIIRNPDKQLLGKPALFPAILNASAFYRIHMLLNSNIMTSNNINSPESIYQEIQKLERLTAKALEVSYIQNEFNKWNKDR